jgi:hypothetical protein
MMLSTSATRLSPRQNRPLASAGLTTAFAPIPLALIAVKLHLEH